MISFTNNHAFINLSFSKKKLSQKLFFHESSVMNNQRALNPTLNFLFVRFFTKNKTSLLYSFPNYSYFTGGSFCKLLGIAKSKTISTTIFLHDFLSKFFSLIGDFFYKNSVLLLKIPLPKLFKYRLFKVVFIRKNRKYRRIKKWLSKRLVKSLK